MSRDTLQLVLLNHLTQQHDHDHDHDKNVSQQQFQNSQTQILTESSSSSEFMVPEIDDHEEGMCASPVNEQLSNSSGVTTLELHPNVILGMPDEEGSPGSQDDDRPHMCTICRASYKTKTHLRRHMYVHMTSRPFPCQECGKGFNRKEHLTKHLEAVHSKCKHLCPYCDKQISRLDHLRRHIKIMHGYPEHSMDTTSTDKSAVLKVQVRGRKHKAQLSFLTPSFPTGTIGQTIITPIPLTATSHANLESTSKKSKRSAAESPLKDDQGMSPSTPPSVFQQEDSQDDSPTSTSMTIIPSNVVGPGEGIATLAIQSTPTQKVLVHQRLPSGSTVNFATATNGLAGLADLSLSLGSHAPPQSSSKTSGTSNNRGSSKSGGGEEKKIFQIFNCGQCNSTFTNEDDLVVHARTHGKPQRHRCPDCPRAYTRREKLTEHIRCVHQGQKFRCEFCGKELSRKDHVLRHIRSVHPEVYAASFAEMDDSQITLDEHGRLVSINNNASSSLTTGSTNQGKKKRTPTKTNFNLPSLGDVGVLLRSVCHVCLKVFGTAYHLTRHIESCHNGDIRPFNCSACNKMFKRKDHLTKHVKSHCPALKADQQPQSKSPQQGEQTIPKLRTGEVTPKSEEPEIPQIIMETHDQHLHHQSSSEMDNGMLSDGSGNSSDCHHTILQNLQVEMDVGQHDDDSIPSSNNQVMSAASSSGGGANMHDDDHTMGGVLIGGDLMKHSNSVGETSATEFSFAVIDSLIQGGVNVVVVNEEISNFLQQTSSSHLTTTFPCAQCQKEFPQRDQLIAHLQEHPTDSMMHGHHHHHQQIADISFPDF